MNLTFSSFLSWIRFRVIIILYTIKFFSLLVNLRHRWCSIRFFIIFCSFFFLNVSKFLKAIFRIFFALVFLLLFRLVNDMKCHWGEQMHFALSFLFLLFFTIWILVFLLNHSHLFFPNSLWAFLQLSIKIFQIITILCESAQTWIKRINFLEATSRNILVN